MSSGDNDTAAPAAGKVKLGIDFRALWASSTAAALGMGMTGVVVPLLAIEVFDADPFAVSVLIAAENMPWLVLGLVAGVWVDRWPKRRVLVVASLVRFGALLALPVLWLAGALNFWNTLFVIAITGMTSIFTTVASVSFLPTLVTGPQLVAANSRLAAGQSGGGLLGEASAGFLYQVIGGPLVLLVEAATSAFSALAISRTRPDVVGPEGSATPRTRFRKELLAGLRITLADRVFRPITISATLTNMAEAARYAVLPSFLVTHLAAPVATVGLVIAAIGVGGLFGSLACERLSKRHGSARVWRAALFMTAVSALLVSFAQPGLGLVVAGVGSFLTGFFGAISNVVSSSARQAICPPHLLGRLAATSRTITWGAIPLGALAGGAIATLIGTQPAFILLVLPILAALAVIWMSPLGRVRAIETLEPMTTGDE